MSTPRFSRRDLLQKWTLATAGLALSRAPQFAPASALSGPALVARLGNAATNPIVQSQSGAVAAGNAWYVDPGNAAGATVPGTIEQPWSLKYASSGADGRIRPGDTVLLRGGLYRPTQEIKIAFSGEPGKPVTWKPVPGEHFELDGSIPEFADSPATAWEVFDVRPAYNVYRSKSAYPAAVNYGGFIQIDGQWLPLATHKTTDWIRVQTDIWNDQLFYLGPGVTQAADGHLIVRLDNSTPVAQCHRAVAQITDPDPRHHALRISAADRFGLIITGSHHVFEDFSAINNYYGAFIVLGAVNDLTFRRVGGRVNRFGARLGQANGLVIEDPSFDGCMNPEKWWVSYVDIKGANTPAVGVRKCGIDYGLSQHVEVSGGYFHDFFDSALSEGAHDVEVHGVEFRTWDDAWQMYGSLYRINLHDNMYIGAGPSRDGTATTSPNPFPGTLWIHDNIIDTTRYRLFYFRFGRPEDPSGIGWREPIPLSGHDVPTSGHWTIPWKFYYNTIVTGIPDLPLNSYVGLGQFGTAQAMVQAKHEVYNTIVVVRNGRALGEEAWATTGAEIYNGNVYHGWGTPQSPTPRSIWRYLQTSSGLVDGDNPPGRIGDAATIHRLTGWEAAGLSVDARLDAQYKPQLVPGNAGIASGAVDLTSTHWPGTEVYKPWRGAVPVQV